MESFPYINTDRADRELKLAWPSASTLSGCEMSQFSLTGIARAPPIKLNRADPLRASLRSVGWHGKLQKNDFSAPS